jgi:hypothetical protein
MLEGAAWRLTRGGGRGYLPSTEPLGDARRRFRLIDAIWLPAVQSGAAYLEFRHDTAL